MAGDFVIYGATGYTGARLARGAVARGQRPVLCARSAARLQPLARELGLEYRVAALEPRELAQAFAGMRAVLNAAGPFSITAQPVVDACLHCGAHYLDVCGELPVFEALHQRQHEAVARGIVVLPGAGFLVVAADCLSAELAREFPAAVALRIAITRPAFLARGSLDTMLGLLDEHVVVRRQGALTRVPVGMLERRFDFGQGERVCSALSSAEVFSTFLSTGIPNIEVYMPASAGERVLYRLGGALAPWLQAAPARLALAALAEQLQGPAEGRGAEQAVIAVLEDARGARLAARLVTPDAYAATVAMALGVLGTLLRSDRAPGFCTPAQICTSDFLRSLPGVSCSHVDARAV